MSSRQEEKQRRREERLAEEAKASASAQRGRRLQLVGGGVLVIAVIAVIVVLVAGGGGDDGGSSPSASADTAPIPAAGPNAKPEKLTDAAKAAGCIVKTFRSEGRGHSTDKQNYKTNPPTSGTHNPTPAEDGIYDAGNTPAKENFVHALEHGRIEIQYKPGTSKKVQDQLVSLFNEKVNGTEGYHTLLFENNTNMKYAVAATGWTQLLGCPTMNPKVFDAIRAFRSRYVDKGPELIA